MTKMLPVQLLEIFQFCFEPLLYILLLLCDFSYGDIKQGKEKNDHRKVTQTIYINPSLHLQIYIPAYPA